MLRIVAVAVGGFWCCFCCLFCVWSGVAGLMFTSLRGSGCWEYTGARYSPAGSYGHIPEVELFLRGLCAVGERALAALLPFI